MSRSIEETHKHGSEERFDVGSGRRAPSPNRSTASTQVATPGELVLHPTWDNNRLSAYLAFVGCEEDTVAVVRNMGYTGTNWIANLTDLRLGDPQDFLDDLLVTDRLRRRKLLQDVLRLETSVKSPSPVSPGSEQSVVMGGVSFRMSDILGRLTDGIPSIPRGSDGDILSAKQFQLYSVGLASHVARFSHTIASGIETVALQWRLLRPEPGSKRALC